MQICSYHVISRLSLPISCLSTFSSRPRYSSSVTPLPHSMNDRLRDSIIWAAVAGTMVRDDSGRAIVVGWRRLKSRCWSCEADHVWAHRACQHDLRSDLRVLDCHCPREPCWLRTRLDTRRQTCLPVRCRSLHTTYCRMNSPTFISVLQIMVRQMVVLDRGLIYRWDGADYGWQAVRIRWKGM